MNQRSKMAVALVAWISLGVFGGRMSSCTGGGESMNVLDLNQVKEKADIILIGKVDAMPLPYEVLGKDFYRIKPGEVLSGKLQTNSLLVIMTDTDSWEGSPAIVEPAFRYLLFLKRVDLSSEGLPHEYTAFGLVGNWKGIISLNKEASERRAIRNIQDNYGIKIHDKAEEFIEAVRFSINGGSGEKEKKAMKLSAGAKKIYEALKLDQEVEKDPEEEN